jgi:hypothetical protein
VCPAVAARRAVYNGTFKHDRSEVTLKPDGKAAEQPITQRIEHGAEGERACGDDGEADEGLDTATADDPVEHFD